MPVDLIAAHDRSFRNRPCIEKSGACGCFYCLKTCVPSIVTKFVRREDTALCPLCGVDALIGDASGLPVTDGDFLQKMHAYWFEHGERVLVPKP